MNARICSVASVVAVTVLLAYASAATAISVDINCAGVKVGTLTVFDAFPLGAEFKANGPTFPTLAANNPQVPQCTVNGFNKVSTPADGNCTCPAGPRAGMKPNLSGGGGYFCSNL